MNAKDAAKWSGNDWHMKVTFIKPSGGGTVGVLFAWTTPNKNKNGKNDWDDPSTCAFVIKPLAGSAGSTVMAEDLLGTIADTASAGTKAIAASSDVGSSLRALLEKFKLAAPDKTRWNQVWPSYASAQNYLLMDFQKNSMELGEEYRKGQKLIDLLWDKSFMSNLGMLMAADAVIGNGDRLWKVNSGNIMFKPGGQLISIDSATVLTNFKELLNAPDQKITPADLIGTPRWGEHGAYDAKTPENWAKNQVGAQQYTDTQIGGVAPSFSMETLWDIDNWWDKQFKGHFEKGISQAQATLPSDYDWLQGKTWFLGGLEEGMSRIDKLFATKSWDWLKLKFKWYTNKKKYGNDPNMDWMNLKVRRKYFKLRRAGVSQQEAENQVLAYVTKKNLVARA